jgi:hypothetical protein
MRSCRSEISLRWWFEWWKVDLGVYAKLNVLPVTSRPVEGEKKGLVLRFHNFYIIVLWLVFLTGQKQRKCSWNFLILLRTLFSIWIFWFIRYRATGPKHYWKKIYFSWFSVSVSAGTRPFHRIFDFLIPKRQYKWVISGKKSAFWNFQFYKSYGQKSEKSRLIFWKSSRAPWIASILKKFNK